MTDVAYKIALAEETKWLDEWIAVYGYTLNADFKRGLVERMVGNAEGIDDLLEDAKKRIAEKVARHDEHIRAEMEEVKATITKVQRLKDAWQASFCPICWIWSKVVWMFKR